MVDNTYKPTKTEMFVCLAFLPLHRLDVKTNTSDYSQTLWATKTLDQKRGKTIATSLGINVNSSNEFDRNYAYVLAAFGKRSWNSSDDILKTIKDCYAKKPKTEFDFELGKIECGLKKLSDPKTCQTKEVKAATAMIDTLLTEICKEKGIVRQLATVTEKSA